MARRAPHHGKPSGPVDQSPWSTGQESTQTPEPGAHRQWRQARADWLQTSRAEDFERMLAAVTLGDDPGPLPGVDPVPGRRAVQGDQEASGCEDRIGRISGLSQLFQETAAWQYDDAPGARSSLSAMLNP